jgi:hypothetical protein
MMTSPFEVVVVAGKLAYVARSRWKMSIDAGASIRS